MDTITSFIIFLGLTFTLVGTMFSIIVFCMLLYVRIKNSCIRVDEIDILIDGGENGDEMENFVKL